MTNRETDRDPLIQGQRPADADTLLLPTGEFRRAVVEALRQT